MHKWVMSFDWTLCIHLIMQYNISPETLVGSFKEKDITVDKILDEKKIKYCNLKDKNITLPLTVHYLKKM